MPQMNLQQLTDHVWNRLTLQKHVAGRRLVDRITRRAIRQWPVAVLAQCDDAQAQVVGTYYTRTITRQARQEYGIGIILSLVLGALVQEIVKLLIQWWMDHRGEMRGMVRECGNDD